jgi:hypothetical protein
MAFTLGKCDEELACAWYRLNHHDFTDNERRDEDRNIDAWLSLRLKAMEAEDAPSPG